MLVKSIYTLITIFIIMPPSSPVNGQDIRVAVIVNTSNPFDEMSAAEVKAYFLKRDKKRWKNGAKIRPVDNAGTSQERALFLEQVLHMSAEDVERYWIEVQYRKALAPPLRIEEDYRIMRLISKFEGGIGYVNLSSLTDQTSDEIKIVHILDMPEYEDDTDL